jgi:hypothetical protein
MQVANYSSATGTISGIVVSGQGFQLSNLPILPLTLPPSATAQFNVKFNASQPGVSTGFLNVGSDVFKLAAKAIGPSLVYSYVQGSTTVILQGSGDTVVAGSLQIGQTSNIPFTIANQGNAPATVSTIALSSAKSAYSLANVPAVPATIAPGGQLSFTIMFSPTALGDNTAQLRVDAATFSLVGSGTSPPALPLVTITGPGPVVGPMQQPAVSLSLASPYSLPLAGVLTMTVSSNHVVIDPAVQFATGGRTVTFTIPANTTQAQFSTGNSVPFQTGTVAASITIGATLATATGVDVTPASPPSISFAVPDGPPQVLSVQAGPQTANSLTVTVTGFSTTRSLTQLTLDFTPTASYQIPGSHYVFDISTSAGLWYVSAESQAFGSLFTATIPFTFQGSDPSATLGQVFQSISATLSNAIGQSNSASFTVQP